MEKVDVKKKEEGVKQWIEEFSKKNFPPNSEEGNKFRRDKLEAFLPLFIRAMNQLNSRSELDWSKVESCQEDHLLNYENLPTTPPSEIKTLLNKVCVLKLNGGLGTSMGLNGPKSALPVHKNSMHFLDIIVSQISHLNKTFGANIPFLLMNSFYTHEKTKEMIQDRYQNNKVEILQFIQKKNPKLDAETFLPISDDINDKSQWNPPGHGDIYDSLVRSEVYEKIVNMGVEYIFLSNVDNLGAIIDLRILGFLVKNRLDFCLEVTPKTLNDIKGGTLIHYDQKNEKSKKRIKLLELAQVPSNYVHEFSSIERFKVFNTNNMWIRLKSIKEQMKNIEKVEIIFNKKTIPHKKSEKSIIQLETACGAAIEYFKNSIGVIVPRSRFLPVKKCQDLFLIQSSLFSIGEDFSYYKNNVNKDLPIVTFESNEWDNINIYNSRIVKYGIPNLKNLKSLKLSGEVIFEGGETIVLIGNCSLIAEEGKKIILKKNTIIKDNERLDD